MWQKQKKNESESTTGPCKNQQMSTEKKNITLTEQNKNYLIIAPFLGMAKNVQKTIN